MKRRIFSCSLVISLVLLGAVACAGQGQATAMTHAQPRETGTVRYLDLEGGCWVIKADDGRSLTPDNLSRAFMKDGLRVSFRSRPLPDRMSVCMAGQIVEIITIEPLDD